MKVKIESEVAQLCPTHSDPTDCSPPGSSVHGIFRARVLEWGAIAFSLIIPTCTNDFAVLHMRILHFREDKVTSKTWILLESDKNKV